MRTLFALVLVLFSGMAGAGYDAHITRKTEWFSDSGPRIALAEWKAYVPTDGQVKRDPLNSENDYLVQLRRLPTRSNWIRALYAVCLLGASFNHASMLWQHGFFWDYGGVPPFTRIFWTALTFVDPTAVVLLFLWPAAGVWLTLAIIITDVAHNTWFGLVHGMAANWMYYSQVVFLAFVLLTIRMALTVAGPQRARPFAGGKSRRH